MFVFYNQNNVNEMETIYLCNRVEVAYFECPFVGLLSFYTYFDSCCGGGQQEIKVTDLINDKVVLNLNIDNYHFEKREDPADHPYGYLKEKGIEYIEVFNAYMRGYIITPLDALDNNVDSKIRDKLTEKKFRKEISALIKVRWKVENIHTDREAIFLLDWDETTKKVKIPIEEIPAIGYDDWGYT